MKKIINGKVYDTETAKKISHYWNGLGTNDFRNLSETLYKSPKGTYFLYGDGGAMTRWSESNGNTTWGSSDIVVLSIDSAKEWLERHGSEDEYASEFEVEEG